jgi:hypothetical protein
MLAGNGPKRALLAEFPLETDRLGGTLDENLEEMG